ncbi:hypothetical protein TNCV_653111 [Trichonephila clavipes]|nr:hypothetical protein TNCV_653111 [Trichonephila clavipes]
MRCKSLESTVPAQESSSSLDRDSKLRGSSPIILVLVQCVNISVALFRYSGAFGDRPRLEPWSRDEEDT